MNLWAFGLTLAVIILLSILITIISKYHKCKYDKIEKDGFQYCLVCNRGIYPITQSCQHKWKTIKESKIIVGKENILIGDHYIMRCEKCGEMKDFKADIRK